MKITVNGMKVFNFYVNYNYIRLSGLVVLGGLGLSGCAPIPQAYPAVPQQQQRPQVNNVPQAAPLLPNKQQGATVQRYAAKPAPQRPVKQQAAVPPTLQPAQQQAKQQQARQQQLARQRQQAAAAEAAATRQAQQRQQSRPAPASTYRPPVVRKTPPAETIAKQQAAPTVTEWEVIETPSVQAPVQPRPQPQSPAAQVQQRAEPEVEVLDMSSSAKTPTSKPVVEKPVPSSSSYQDNPAIAILTKQANNQLVVGKTDQAASTLERALRIAPDNPMLWLRLAEVNEQQGNKAQAASMAKKAIGLAPGDANIKQRGSRLIN